MKQLGFCSHKPSPEDPRRKVSKRPRTRSGVYLEETKTYISMQPLSSLSTRWNSICVVTSTCYKDGTGRTTYLFPGSQLNKMMPLYFLISLRTHEPRPSGNSPPFSELSCSSVLCVMLSHGLASRVPCPVWAVLLLRLGAPSCSASSHQGPHLSSPPHFINSQHCCLEA